MFSPSMSLRQPMFAATRRMLHSRTWELPASAGGTLKARLPTNCTLKVTPSDPTTHDWASAKVDLHILPETDDSPMTDVTASQVADNLNLSVLADSEPGRNFLQIEAPRESTPTSIARGLHRLRAWLGGPFRAKSPRFDSHVVIHAFVPGRFDLDLELAEGAVVVQNTFEGDVKILTEGADVTVEKIKGSYVNIESDDGDIHADVIQGNLSIRTASGDSRIGRVQGPSVALVSGSGNVRMRALYADYAMLRTREGAVTLSGAQGYTKVRTIEGDVEVAGVEGRLDVETDTGDIGANLSMPKMASIRSRTGDISLGLSHSITASLLLEGGSSIDLRDDVQLQEVPHAEDKKIMRGVVHALQRKSDEEGTRASVHARAPQGDVSVKRQSWCDNGSGVGMQDRLNSDMTNVA